MRFATSHIGATLLVASQRSQNMKERTWWMPSGNAEDRCAISHKGTPMVQQKYQRELCGISAYAVDKTRQLSY